MQTYTHTTYTHLHVIRVCALYMVTIIEHGFSSCAYYSRPIRENMVIKVRIMCTQVTKNTHRQVNEVDNEKCQVNEDFIAHKRLRYLDEMTKVYLLIQFSTNHDR